MVRRHLVVAVAAVLLTSCAMGQTDASRDGPSPDLEPLPSPETEGHLALEAALAARRSVRAFAAQALSKAEIGQLLWAAQGITSGGRRTAPSAGAIYPLELYVATAGELVRYQPNGHATELLRAEDVRGDLADAGLGQEALLEAPAIFVVAAVTERTAARYGDRAERYVQLEAGHAAQNLLLQAVSLGLGAVPIGSFDDDAVSSVLRLANGARPLYLIAVGQPAE